MPTFEKPELSEKKMRWREKELEIERIGKEDSVPLDEGIKEAVIALRAFEFPTSKSCYGHIIKNRRNEAGEPTSAVDPDSWTMPPFITINAPYEKVASEASEKIRKEENKRLKEHLSNLLKNFYSKKETSPDIEITISGDEGEPFKMTNKSQSEWQNLPIEEQERIIKAWRKEIEDFAQFLKQMYFEGDQK